MVVDVDDLIAKAWGAVEKAGVPGPVQGVALKEAIDFLREADEGHTTNSRRSKRPTGKPRAESAGGKGVDQRSAEELPDEAAFFSQLADESGVDEVVLRDVLQLKDAAVHVIPPTRKLGDSKANQSRQLIALVAGAYAHGLDRSPVDAVAVREEPSARSVSTPLISPPFSSQ